MQFDWNFIARNLAKHLCVLGADTAAELVLHQAEADAVALEAPADFWRRVAAAYEDETRRAGRVGSELVLASLRRHDGAARQI